MTFKWDTIIMGGYLYTCGQVKYLTLNLIEAVHQNQIQFICWGIRE